MFLESISPVHPALRAWRRTRATRSVGTWDCQTSPWPYRAWRQQPLASQSGASTWQRSPWRMAVGLDGNCREVGGAKAISDARREKGSCHAKSAWNASCISLACPHSSALALTKLAHDCWWCVHICVGVCGVL